MPGKHDHPRAREGQGKIQEGRSMGRSLRSVRCIRSRTWRWQADQCTWRRQRSLFRSGNQDDADENMEIEVSSLRVTKRLV